MKKYNWILTRVISIVYILHRNISSGGENIKQNCCLMRVFLFICNWFIKLKIHASPNLSDYLYCEFLVWSSETVAEGSAKSKGVTYIHHSFVVCLYVYMYVYV